MLVRHQFKGTGLDFSERSIGVLRLALTAGIGRVRLRQLLQRFGTSLGTSCPSLDQLCTVPGIGPVEAESIRRAADLHLDVGVGGHGRRLG